MKKPKKEKSKDDQTVELKKQIEELKIGWQRTQADFDNYCKKTETGSLENLAYAKAEFMAKLTPVLDNFRRAFEHTPKKEQNSDWVKGIKQIEKQLEDILASEGLTRIPANSGDKFDPNIHEAVTCEENHLPQDTIITELESGWAFDGKVIKPAKVRVSKGK